MEGAGQPVRCDGQGNDNGDEQRQHAVGSHCDVDQRESKVELLEVVENALWHVHVLGAHQMPLQANQHRGLVEQAPHALEFVADARTPDCSADSATPGVRPGGTDHQTSGRCAMAGASAGQRRRSTVAGVPRSSRAIWYSRSSAWVQGGVGVGVQVRVRQGR